MPTVRDQEIALRKAMEEQGTSSKATLEYLGSLDKITGAIKISAHPILLGTYDVPAEDETLEQITRKSMEEVPMQHKPVDELLRLYEAKRKVLAKARLEQAQQEQEPSREGPSHTGGRPACLDSGYGLTVTHNIPGAWKPELGKFPYIFKKFFEVFEKFPYVFAKSP
jgi:hypothetical protein